MAGESISNWSSIVGTWVSICGAAGGGFYALQTYEEEVAKMEDARVVQTFQLFEMFNSPSRLQSRADLFEYTKNGGDLDANDLYVMLDFFDALQICVERNLCDQDLAVRLFQSYAVPFWDELDETILNSRTDSDPRFGAGLQWLAGMPMPAPLEDGGTPPVVEPAAVEAPAIEPAVEAPMEVTPEAIAEPPPAE